LHGGVLYFTVSVAVSIVDIVFLKAINQPLVTSTIIPLHITLASIMMTCLVNNVFYILKVDQVSPHFISNTCGASNMKVMSIKSAMAFALRGSASMATTKTVLVVGSGVGTDYFDKINYCEGEAGKAEILGTISNAYPVSLND